MSEIRKSSEDDFDQDMEETLKRFDALLDRGVEKISKIDTDEFVKGLSAEELETKIGANGSLAINRSQFSTVRKISMLRFPDGIQYLVGNQDQQLEDLPIEDIDQLKEVQCSERVAVCDSDESNPDLFNELNERYSKDYQARAGIIIKQHSNRLEFLAARTGKVVVVNNTLYIIPSDRDGICTVHLSEDHMEASIDCTAARGNGTKLTIATILDTLASVGVRQGIDMAAIEDTVKKINMEEASCIHGIAAKGQLPVNGKDAEIITRYAVESDEIGFKILPDGRIDYKKQAPIKMVQAGELLVSVTEPEAGTDGFTVTNEILPAKNGSAEVIFEGENVHKDPDSKHYYAECSGMVSLHDKVLSVFPMYQVNGDVDLKSGNINFNGSVTILGNVRSGFEVKASGDIFITGSTEAATIDAGRDIRINGAIVGGGKTLIKAGRNIFAGHVQNAHLESQGDVTIVRSIMHSTILSTGKLILHDRDGSIIGGSINAMRGLEVMSIGSHVGTHTEVIIGSDFLIQQKKKELQEIAEYYKMNIEKIDLVLRPLMEFLKKGIPLGAEKKRRLATIVDKRKSSDKQFRLLKFRINELSEVDPMVTNAAIIAQKTIFQDVVLKIGTAVLITKKEFQGVRCTLSTDKKYIEIKQLNFINF